MLNRSGKTDHIMDLKQKREIAYGRHIRAFNCPSSVNAKDLEITLELPGWSYGDFAGNGKLALWRMAKVFEINRLIMHMPNEYGAVLHTNDETAVGAQVMNFSRRLQNEASIIFPMIIKVTMDYIKDSSFVWGIEITAKESGYLLASLSRQVVYFNLQTSKKTQIPAKLAAFKDRFPVGESLTVKIPPMPQEVFRYDVRVAASDMDQIYHTNQATYYRFCMDAAAEAWRAGALTFDPDERDVRRTEARHLGETFGGDGLTVCLWSEAQGREPRLHCVIEKRENQVFCCNIVFYPQLDTAKL